MSAGAPLLEIEAMSVRFGGVVALDRVDLTVEAGSIHGLIGPNGAGKTTLLNVISRLVQPTEGSVRFADHDMLAYAPYQITRLGVARTFQNLGLIEEASVLDNVLVGLHTVHEGTLLDDLVRFWRRNRIEREMRARALEMLRQVGLEEVARVPVKQLAYGIRKNTELARACVGRPKLLMLDEPTAGLNGAEMERLSRLLFRINRDEGLTILVITHHVEFLLELAHVTTVLDLGRRIAHGNPHDVRNDPDVIAAYIGTE